MKIVTLGSAVIDIFVHSAEFEVKTGRGDALLCQLYGDKLEADLFAVRTGGGGTNTAVGFARLGHKVWSICETGQDEFSQLVLSDLEREGVETEYVVKEKKEQTGGTVALIGTDGGRTLIVHRGAASMLDPQDIPAKAIAAADWVHLSSIGGRRPALESLWQLLASEKGNGRRPRLSWNPGKGEIELLLRRQVSLTDVQCEVLFVNLEEWGLLKPVHEQLHQHCNFVVVTNGKAGGAVSHAGRQVHEYQVSAHSAKDETGAGDAFAVGFVGALLLNKNVSSACVAGKRNAASVVSEIGAKPGLLDYHQLFSDNKDS